MDTRLTAPSDSEPLPRSGPTPSRSAPGSRRLLRFVPAERLAHWFYAALFLGALITGLVMLLPASRSWIAGDRHGFAQYHSVVGFTMMILPLVLFVLMDRRCLLAAVREVDMWSTYDRRWFWAALNLRMLRGRKMPPQGRLNAGQKTYSVVVAVMTLGFAVTGSLLLARPHLPAWLVLRALQMHDFLATAGAALLVGHLVNVFLTRHGRASLVAMIRGTYPEELARKHHLLWWEEEVGRRKAG